MWRNLKSRFFVASGRIVVVVEIGDWSQERTLSQPMRPDWRLESACSESQRQCYNLQQTTTVQNTFPAPPLIHLCLIPVKRLLSVKAAWRVNPMSKVWKVHLWQEIYQISILLNWPLADYISPDTLTLSPGTFINLPSDQRAWHVVMCPGNPYFKLQAPSWQKARWKYLLWKLCRHWTQWPSNQWSPAPWPRQMTGPLATLHIIQLNVSWLCSGTGIAVNMENCW